jgi:sugar lactone lactonase YvrE
MARFRSESQVWRLRGDLGSMAGWRLPPVCAEFPEYGFPHPIESEVVMRLSAIRRTSFAIVLGATLVIPAFLLPLIAMIALASPLAGQQPPAGPLATPLTDAIVDYTALGQWVDGSERPVANASSPQSAQALLHPILWSLASASTAVKALPFGDSKQPGLRHLRIGFKSPVQVGSILVRGGGTLSVLRPGVAYPGNLADDSQWIAAEHTDLAGGATTNSSAEVAPDGFALWVLPASVQTRALRFSHTAVATDGSYAGSLGGVYLVAGRFANLAPEANVLTSANRSAAPLLVDLQINGWGTWDNGPTYDHVVNAAHPESIILSWPQTVSLSGVAALWAGFNAGDVSIFTGPAFPGGSGAALEDAPESSWRPVGKPWQLRNQYPVQLGVDWLDFGATVQTRAIRVRLTQATDESHHPHLVGKTHNGQRVWLGELMALSPLGTAQLKASLQALAARQASTPNPPIAVRFTLPSAAYVSLVIDDAQGNRVRNLVSDTLFPAGANTAWWDGTNDLLREPDAAAHGQYLIPTQFVAPGRYTVRGITHSAIDLHYEFSVYSPGNPPWETLDGTGGWLTNHTPPSSALFVPAGAAPGGKPLVYLGCWYGEGPSALAWVDLDGNRKGGQATVGGSWTGAQALARDAGPRANKDVFAYTAAIFSDKKAGAISGVFRLNGLTAHGDKPILNWTANLGSQPPTPAAETALLQPQIGGLAAYNGQLIVSMRLLNQLLFVDALTNTVSGTASLDSPRGAAFDASGNLLVLSGKRLLRFHAPTARQLGSPEVVVSDHLEDPSGLAIDSDGTLYISDHGSSNQVKVFTAAGKFLRAIGHAGPSQAGPYDALHMNHPHGITIDSNHHLWVAEEDFQPKRVSVWTLDGALVKAFYGPTEYGGGGSIDPKDKSLFYYHGMQFKLDWTAGTNTLTSVLYREDNDPFPLPKYAEPDTAVYANGRRYFENTYLEQPTNGSGIAMIYLDHDGVLHPVAALGRVSDWSLLADSRFQPLLPANANPTSRQPNDQMIFTWSDINNDGKVDPAEVTILKGVSGGITVMPDLSVVDSFVDGNARRYAPVRFTPTGVPVYDLHSGQVIAEGAQQAVADGGGQSLYSAADTVLTTAPAPFSQDGLGGVESNGHRWSYPSLWPGLHPAHAAPRPDRPGELEGTTRLLGEFVHPAGSDAGALWGINGNFGATYLFTADGLYVTQMLQDVRVGKPWSVPQAIRNMLVNDLSPHDENFFPSMTQSQDGNVYLVNGRNAAIVRVDGLSTIHRLPSITLDIGKQDLDNSQSFLKQVELSRQIRQGSQSLKVQIHLGPAPSLGNAFAALTQAQWATIDQRITQVGWNQNPDLVRAALTIQGDRLYVAYRTGDPKLLVNSAATANAPFKDGGALDLMIGTDPHANPKRMVPVAGDVRLLVYSVNGKTKAMLYRAVMPGTANPVAFSSPSRTITLDRVEDVSSSISLEAKTGQDSGSYVFSIPLATLGLHVAPGDRIKADIGILRGNGVQTVQRVYWNNKATGITSDVPSEAELTPNLWGDWLFEAAQ